MDYLNTDITNPFFQGYANESDELFNFKEKVKKIAMCGSRVEASELTSRLIKEGVKPEDMTPSQLKIIDDIFDCY